MQIILKRYRSSKWGVDGHLLIDNQIYCDTVEHPTRFLEAGTYLLQIKYSKEHGRPVPFLNRLDKKGRPQYRNPTTHIRTGNGPHRLSNGSFLVGIHYLPGVVTLTSIVFDNFMDLLSKNPSSTLTIIE